MSLDFFEVRKHQEEPEEESLLPIPPASPVTIEERITSASPKGAYSFVLIERPSGSGKTPYNTYEGALVREERIYFSAQLLKKIGTGRTVFLSVDPRNEVFRIVTAKEGTPKTYKMTKSNTVSLQTARYGLKMGRYTLEHFEMYQTTGETIYEMIFKWERDHIPTSRAPRRKF